jgi:hypothetical protein
LTKRGILHRDISAGNVFLFDPQGNDTLMSPGEEGFLADVELASMPPLSTEYQAEQAHASPPVPGQLFDPLLSQHPRLAQITSSHTFSKEITSQPKENHGPDMTVDIRTIRPI